jgi:hypothetical protein
MKSLISGSDRGYEVKPKCFWDKSTGRCVRSRVEPPAGIFENKSSQGAPSGISCDIMRHLSRSFPLALRENGCLYGSAYWRRVLGRVLWPIGAGVGAWIWGGCGAEQRGRLMAPERCGWNHAQKYHAKSTGNVPWAFFILVAVLPCPALVGRSTFRHLGLNPLSPIAD